MTLVLRLTQKSTLGKYLSEPAAEGVSILILDRYFTTGKVMTMEELSSVQGRAWEDVDH